MNTFPRITKSNTSHLYRLEVTKDGAKGQVDVEANTRSQAANMARKAGYEVASVNMIG